MAVRPPSWLLAGVVGIAMGFFLAFAHIGWTVLAANGIRDLSLDAMQHQAKAIREQQDALHQCRIAVPKATNRRPKRFLL
jgi:hypothetical protein